MKEQTATTINGNTSIKKKIRYSICYACSITVIQRRTTNRKYTYMISEKIKLNQNLCMHRTRFHDLGNESSIQNIAITFNAHIFVVFLLMPLLLLLLLSIFLLYFLSSNSTLIDINDQRTEHAINILNTPNSVERYHPHN